MTIIDISTVYEENKNIKERLVQMESKLCKIESMVKAIDSNLFNLCVRQNLVAPTANSEGQIMKPDLNNPATITPFEISDHMCEQIDKKSNEDIIEDAIEKTIEARRRGSTKFFI